MEQREHRFERAVIIAGAGGRREVKGAADAKRILADVDWPVRGPRYDNAIDACLKVIDGHRSAENARRAFVEAAREAGILEAD